MDTVVVMDTLVVFLSEASKSWWATNAYWWVPVLTIIVTLAGMYISTRTSIKNTNNQIINQNIEGRRPYIKIVKVGKNIDLNEPKYYINCKNPEHDSTAYINRSLEIKNIGYGPSENVIIKTRDEIPIKKYQLIVCATTNKITDRSDTTVSLGVNETDNLNLEVVVTGPVKYRPKFIDIIILYSDLLNNIYQTNARIGLTHQLKSSQYVEKSKNWEIFFNDDGEKDYRRKI